MCKMISIKSDFMILCAFINTRKRYWVCMSAIYLLYTTFPRTVSVSCDSAITSDTILQMHKSNSIKQLILFLIERVLPKYVWTPELS